MYLYSILAGPVSYGYHAYKSAQYRFSIPTCEFNLVNQIEGNKIKEIMRPFLEKMNIRSDLILFEKLNGWFCEAKGTNFFTESDAAIFLCPGLFNRDTDACSWVLKHEICHIKYNDPFISKVIPAISTLFAAIIIPSLTNSILTSVLSTTSIGLISAVLFHRFFERRADDFAIANSSVEELKGGRRLIISVIKHNLESTTRLDKILFSSTGENRLDIIHPSLGSRLKKIEDELAKRKVVMSEEEEQKINELTEFMNQKLNEFLETKSL